MREAGRVLDHVMMQIPTWHQIILRSPSPLHHFPHPGQVRYTQTTMRLASFVSGLFVLVTLFSSTCEFLVASRMNPAR